MRQDHILVANDIAGLGKVALTAALPLFAVCQLEVAILPTVLLSSHTGGFNGVYSEDYQHGMEAFLKQWQELHIPFSAIMTGYFKSERQMQLVKDFAENSELPLLIDPIMGDKGQLYQGFDESFVAAMRKYCHRAKLIVPNLTEACYLLDLAYPSVPLTVAEYEELARDLAQKFSIEHVILTGLDLGEEQIGVAYFQQQTQNFQLFKGKQVKQHFIGTGDVFSALLVATYVKNISLSKAIPKIMHFIEKSLLTMLANKMDRKLGVYYQPYLGEWIQVFQELLEENNEKQSSQY